MRDNGVQHLKSADLELTLAHEALLPTKTPISTHNEVPSENPYAAFPDGELSPEQLMFYSSGGDPKDDPENN